MSKSTTYVKAQVKKLLKTNVDGSQQFGVRDQFGVLEKKLGLPSASHWLARHIEVTLWARGMLGDSTIIGGDSETTGFTESDEMCELAIVALETEMVLFSSLVRPTCPISHSATGVHGISNEMVRHENTFAELRPAMCKAIEGASAILMYNGEFDIRLAAQSAFAAGVERLPWPPVIDLMVPISEWIGDWNPAQKGMRWAKLEGGHRALGDVLEMFNALRMVASSNVTYCTELLEKKAKNNG